jgi:beta-glucosidase-like glycosyl hydrolase
MGRGQETPGEDPYVNSQYAINYVTGLQSKLEDANAPGIIKVFCFFLFEEKQGGGI